MSVLQKSESLQGWLLSVLGERWARLLWASERKPDVLVLEPSLVLIPPLVIRTL